MNVPLVADVVPLDYVLRTYSRLTMLLMVPVSLTIFVVVWGVRNLTPLYAARDQSPLYLAADESTAGSSSEKLQASTINALVVVGMVLGITFLMVILYKLNCMKIIVAWFVLSAAMIFWLLAWVWADLVCTKYQIPYDYLGMAFFLWNFGIVGILALFYYAPPKMMQGYLVFLSIIMGWMLTRLPEWTTWAILLAVAIYDICAVLLPGGPLQLLVREAQARNEPIPGFVYDSGDSAIVAADAPAPRPNPPGIPAAPQAQRSSVASPASRSSRSAADASDSHEASEMLPRTPASQPPTSPGAASPRGPPAATATPAPTAATAAANESDDEDPDPFESADIATPFKLGLGDFIFYSLLVGRAAQFSYVSWMTCYICVINGLVGTLTCLLFLRGKVPALPALPFSIFAGVAAYFVTKYSTVPFNYYVSLASLTL